MGVKAAHLPTLRLISPEETILTYEFPTDVLKGITVDQIKTFVADYKSGALKPLLKSK